jgi:hypothetical protein
MVVKNRATEERIIPIPNSIQGANDAPKRLLARKLDSYRLEAVPTTPEPANCSPNMRLMLRPKKITAGSVPEMTINTPNIRGGTSSKEQVPSG